MCVGGWGVGGGGTPPLGRVQEKDYVNLGDVCVGVCGIFYSCFLLSLTLIE